MQDLSHVCDLHHSSRQRQILNPLSEARDQTRILMDTSQVHYRWASTGTPRESSLFMQPIDSASTLIHNFNNFWESEIA